MINYIVVIKINSKGPINWGSAFVSQWRDYGVTSGKTEPRIARINADKIK